jgi:DNA-binding NarL/FixJ family response regulator
LELMGFQGRPSRSPVVLALAAHAAAGARLAAAAVEWQTDANGPIVLLRVARIDAGLEQTLTPKVLAALRPFIDGETHEQIAAHAGRSKNTIGNQLHTAGNKLGASGRFAVIARLVQRGLGFDS